MSDSPIENYNVWRDRYYELESTLEQILYQYSKVQLEESPFVEAKLRKVVRSSSLGFDQIVAVADGENMEYSFRFEKDGVVLLETGFQRSNSYPLTAASIQGFSNCVVSVKYNDGPARGKIHQRSWKP